MSERRMFSQVEELLPVISFGSKKDSDTEKKHEDFVNRMAERGYTERQVRRLAERYMRGGEKITATCQGSVTLMPISR